MTDEPTTVLLVRHGQTEWNRLDRFRGRADVELNDVGRLQAVSIARRLSALQVSAVYSSPLRRALDTARPVAERFGLDVLPLEGLIDIDYGAWQGLGPKGVQRRYAEAYEVWLTAPHLVHIPGGESLAQVRERSLAALTQVAHKHHGQAIVLVSHRLVCKVLMCAVLGLDNSPFWQIEQDNGAINVFEVRGSGFTVNLVNDTCHLDSAILGKRGLT